MSLLDWIKDEPCEPLTLDDLNRYWSAMLQRGSELPHRCEFDGHVVAFGTSSCMYCHQQVM